MRKRKCHTRDGRRVSDWTQRLLALRLDQRARRGGDIESREPDWVPQEVDGECGCVFCHRIPVILNRRSMQLNGVPCRTDGKSTDLMQLTSFDRVPEKLNLAYTAEFTRFAVETESQDTFRSAHGLTS